MKIMVYDGPRQLHVEEAPSLPMGKEQIRIKTLYSGISHGTEMSIYRGIAPFYTRRQDPETRLFLPAESCDVWRFPVRSCDPGVWYMGYAAVGEVVEAGENVKNLKKGDIVAVSAPHQSESVVDAAGAYVLPKGLPPEYGIFFTNLLTTFNGIMDSHITLGETVAVSGLGVLGQLVCQMARMSGARQVFGIDMLAPRRQAALENGCDEVFDPAAADVALEIRRRTGNRGADKVIEVSGNSRALNEAIRIAAPETTVTAISWYQGELKNVNLSEEFHHNRIGIKQSQTNHIDPSFRELWDYARRVDTCMELLGRLKLANLITQRFNYDHISDAYALIDKNPDKVIQAMITY